ncbi:MAG: CAP domain-containing protein, partial [Microthrixaceae bacterium]|nr:CAP domain-containing protein [Microthrixaceae bacterium]
MRSRPLRLALAALVALLAVVVAACDETTDAQRSQAIGLINSERSSRGIAKLSQASDLNAKAGNWAAKMRDECKLSHSKLSDGVTLSWRALGENVGYSSSISKIHTNLMNSSGHRANILNSSYDRVGVGIAT